MNSNNNTLNKKENNDYISAENELNNRLETKKGAKKIAFMGLGIAAVGAATIVGGLTGQFSNTIAPIIGGLGVLGTGMGIPLFSLLTQPLLDGNIKRAEDTLVKAYAKVTDEQKEGLLKNIDNANSSIAQMRQKYLNSEVSSKNKMEL